MNSFIKSRVVKSQAVEVLNPRVVEIDAEEFLHLRQRLTVVQEIPSPADSPDELAELTSNAQAEALAEAQKIIDQAQAQAEQLRSQAETEIAELKQRISEEVTEVTAKAQSEGFEKGLTQGKTEGYDEGIAQGEHEIAEKVQQSKTLLQYLQNAVKDEFAKVDHDLLHLSIKIAEQVIRASLEIKPELLLKQIKALTLFPQEREGWRLHIAPEDFGWLQNSDFATQLNLSYIPDDTLHQGECFLECSEGIFDSRLELQLAHLEQLLREELNHEGLEQSCP
ncbi:FliH/SctL family protein [Desulfitobacterium sp.]|uniref:FliH/SctL family protein n=1 Tax=Desulfitobacterium sp. TaxID=49981 RepID=UPI002B20BA57|nr:FliH/SctL family protein [Desulfitobacterium sp.]MEA4900838.1 FliH/SctL family protein [Desulfitobacterium sp.]